MAVILCLGGLLLPGGGSGAANPPKKNFAFFLFSGSVPSEKNLWKCIHRLVGMAIRAPRVSAAGPMSDVAIV